jgi:chorismate mutase
MTNNVNFYLVRSEAVPEIFKKTVKAKELLKKGIVYTVNDAAEMVGMSRSAFYKYKDFVFPFFEASRGNIITISLVLEHRPGVLSNILNIIASSKGSVLTINQNIPVQGIAGVNIAIETVELKCSTEELINRIETLEGVAKIEIIAQEKY